MSLLQLIAGSPPGWQLQDGHYYTSAYAPTIINPQPSLNTNSYYYRTYPGLQWKVPISVFGGSRPLNVTVSGPTGMRVEKTSHPVTYYLIWDNPTTSGSPHSYTVTVEDQDGRTDNVSATLTVQTTNTIFVDATNGSRTGTGAIGDPLKEIYDWWLPDGVAAFGSRDDTTYQNYHVYYRTGTYYTGWEWDTASQIDGQMKMRGFKPRVHIAYPGESVIIDTGGDGGAQNNGGCFFHGDGNATLYDLFYRGLTFQGYAENTSSAYWYKTFYIATWAGNATGRAVWSECTFGNQTNGGVVGQNPCHIFLSDTATTENTQNISIHGCTINDLEAAGAPNNAMMMVEAYSLQYLVLEGNTIGGTSAFWTHFIYGKVDSEYVGIYGNKNTTSTQLFHLGTASNDASTYSMANWEIMWNNCKDPNGTYNTHYQIGIEGVGDGVYKQFGPLYICRNTLTGGTAQHGNTGKTIATGPVNYDSNVTQYDSGTDGITTLGTFNATVNRTAAGNGAADTIDDDLVATSGLVDGTTNLLTGTARTNYLGFKGHEES